jgi:hypothetical protein
MERISFFMDYSGLIEDMTGDKYDYSGAVND